MHGRQHVCFISAAYCTAPHHHHHQQQQTSPDSQIKHELCHRDRRSARQGSPNDRNKKNKKKQMQMITWGFPLARNLSLSRWLSGWIAATVCGLGEKKINTDWCRGRDHAGLGPVFGWERPTPAFPKLDVLFVSVLIQRRRSFVDRCHGYTLSGTRQARGCDVQAVQTTSFDVRSRETGIKGCGGQAPQVHHSHFPLRSFNCARNNKTTSVFNGATTRVWSWKTPSRLGRLQSSDTALTRRRRLPAVA